MFGEGSTADIRIILSACIPGQDSVPRYVGIIAGNSVVSERCALIHIGSITGNGVIKNPGVIVRFTGQIALALDKTAHISGLHFRPNIAERADTVEERILRMCNIRDFIFLIGRFYQLLR